MKSIFNSGKRKRNHSPVSTDTESDYEGTAEHLHKKLVPARVDVSLSEQAMSQVNTAMFQFPFYEFLNPFYGISLLPETFCNLFGLSKEILNSNLKQLARPDLNMNLNANQLCNSKERLQVNKKKEFNFEHMSQNLEHSSSSENECETKGLKSKKNLYNSFV